MVSLRHKINGFIFSRSTLYAGSLSSQGIPTLQQKHWGHLLKSHLAHYGIWEAFQRLKNEKINKEKATMEIKFFWACLLI